MLESCAQAGDFRRDTDPEDILLLLGFLWRLPPGPEAEQRADRLIELVIHGLRSPDSRRRSGRGSDA
ncbi:SbtR family transcriptional regulator [Acidisoma sp. 7E03]